MTKLVFTVFYVNYHDKLEEFYPDVMKTKTTLVPQQGIRDFRNINSEKVEFPLPKLKLSRYPDLEQLGFRTG